MRASIAARIGSPTGASAGVNTSEPRNSPRRSIGSVDSEPMCRSRKVTASASGLRRAPPHARHGRLRTNRRMFRFRLRLRICSITGRIPL